MYNPLAPIAEQTLGSIGAPVAILMLIAAMVLLTNTAMNGASRAMRSMAKHGELPKWFGKTNKHGVPFRGMIAISIFNMFLILLKYPIYVLAASNMGYILCNSLANFAFVDTKLNSEKFKGYIEKAFKAPKGWIISGLFFGILNVPFFYIGVYYTNGLGPTAIGLGILFSILPIWYLTRKARGNSTSTSGGN